MAEKFKFVKTRIEKLTYTGNGKARQVVWDTELPGARFGLYITPSGIKTYFTQGRYPNGKAVQTVIGRAEIYSPEDARQVAIEYQKLYAAGKNPKRVEAAARELTLETLFEDYLSTRKIKVSTKDLYRTQFDCHFGEWKGLQPAEITKSMVMKRHKELTEKKEGLTAKGRKITRGGKRAADGAMQLLGFLFDFGMDTYEDQVTKNPVRVLSKIKAFHGVSPRTGYLKPDQLKTWLEGVNTLESDTARDYFMTLLLTGGRADEVENLKIGDVNLPGGYGVLRKTKNGKPLYIPFCAHLMGIFKRRAALLENDPEQWMFPSYGKCGHYQDPRGAIEAVTETTGIVFTPHYFRRGYKTYGKNLKIDGLIMNRLQNHAMPSRNDMAEWYTQHEIEDLRPVVEQIAQYILRHAGVETCKVIPLRQTA